MPASTVIDRESPVATSPSLDTGTSFIVGLAEKGPVGVATKRRNQALYEALYGGVTSYGYLHDAARLIPPAGGSDQYYSRVVGPSAKASSVIFKDGSSANTMEVMAIDPGAWGDDIDIKNVLTSGSFTIAVSYKDVLVESMPAKGTVAEAVTWALTSKYVRIKDLGGTDPVTAEKPLAGGTDDRGNITITEKKAAIAAFTADLGPGQVLYPGDTTIATRTALAEHAKAANRIVVPDGADSHTVATHTGAYGELAALADNLRECSFQPFGPWLTVDDVGGTTKTIPPSILVAARISAHDGETYNSALGISNPNEPAAGINGILSTATGLSQAAWTDAEVETLAVGGLNVIREVNGQIRIYGYRTLADPEDDQLNLFANNRRLDMALKAKADAIGENYVVSHQVDGRGHTLGDFAGDLRGMLAPYVTIEALFEKDNTPGFVVDVSEQINSDEDVAAGRIAALIKVRRSPLAEYVDIYYQREAVA